MYREVREIEEIVAQFEACRLPFAQWTHHAHLTVGCWYLIHYPLDEATERIREGIQRYNLANGVLQTPTGGYHESITRFFIWAIGRYLDETPAELCVVERVNGLLRSRYGDRKFPLEFYTRERLFSWEARTGWEEPDLRALD